jgi:hypothetical protein
LREHLEQQALVARREMVASGGLIPEGEFLKRLGVTEEPLRSLAADASIFSIAVDGVAYYPALFAESSLG